MEPSPERQLRKARSGVGSRSRLFNGFDTLNARVDLLAVSNEAMREDINRLVRLLTPKENHETSLTAERGNEREVSCNPSS